MVIITLTSAVDFVLIGSTGHCSALNTAVGCCWCCANVVGKIISRFSHMCCSAAIKPILEILTSNETYNKRHENNDKKNNDNKKKC